MAQRFSLEPHVRACEVDGQFVLLDLRRGRYIGVDRRQGLRLGTAIAGWPTEPAAGATADVTPLVAPLLAQGLVSRVAATHEIDAPRASLDLRTPTGRIDVRQVIRFAAASALAAWRLQHRPLSEIVDHVARQRTNASDGQENPIERLRHAAAVFQTLRPLAFTSRDKCLFDSLALMTFLAYDHLHPHWVIGVKTNPFRAHSWVQAGDLVLNDLHENVRRFRPLLVV